MRDAFGSTYELSVAQCHAGIYCLRKGQSLDMSVHAGQGYLMYIQLCHITGIHKIYGIAVYTYAWQSKANKIKNVTLSTLYHD